MTRKTSPLRFAAYALSLVGLLTAGRAHAAAWEIDPSHSGAQFSVRHLMVSNVRGEFGKVTGTIEYNDKDPSKSRVEATIDVSSINTREPKRDEHLKGADFFDVAKFPTITFKSKRVAQAGAGKLKVTGDLSIHGVTREVVLDVEGPAAETKDPWGNIRTGAQATTKINRKDFGLGWNKLLESGGVAVGEEVSITIDVEMTRKQDKPAK
ncbi:MAG: YceI family protein [Polyangia bacterium]